MRPKAAPTWAKRMLRHRYPYLDTLGKRRKAYRAEIKRALIGDVAQQLNQTLTNEFFAGERERYSLFDTRS
jgi:hypothetical protein